MSNRMPDDEFAELDSLQIMPGSFADDMRRYIKAERAENDKLKRREFGVSDSEAMASLDGYIDENKALKQVLDKYRNGYQGSCWCCEPVGMKNVELNSAIERIKALPRFAVNQKIGREGEYPLYQDPTGSWLGAGDVYDALKGIDAPKNSAVAQARAEVAQEIFLEKVNQEKERIKLKAGRSLWQRICPFTISIRRR